MSGYVSTHEVNTNRKYEVLHAWNMSTVVLMREHERANDSTGGQTGERLVPIAEAQRRLMGITRAEIYNRINAGDLKSAKLGRRRGIVESSLNAYIARLIEEEAERAEVVA